MTIGKVHYESPNMSDEVKGQIEHRKQTLVEGARSNGSSDNYESFLSQKSLVHETAGIEVDRGAIHNMLYEFQKDITRWALRKGRAAIFADCGLGKTFMQLEWARLTAEDALIIAPLSVNQQTIREADKIGMEVRYSDDGAKESRFTITNYEQVHKFDTSDFGAVVLDESSILKAIDSKTRKMLTEKFSNTPFRLCCTATPAPNDQTEIGNHAQFLGVMDYQEMLSAFFSHDSGDTAKGGWELKGHAEEAFYRWLASWSVAIRKPSDLDYPDEGFELPALNIDPVWVASNDRPEGTLFHTGLNGVRDRMRVRRETLTDRCDMAARMVNESSEQWIVWCGLNDESSLLSQRIPDSVEVQGSDSPEHKTSAIESFQNGTTRVLVTKPSICGFGMNFQHCRNMAFVGLNDSWETYYQAIRRCYRFGQERPVNVKLVLSERQEDIYRNVMQKEKDAEATAERLTEHMKVYEKEEIYGMAHDDYEYSTDYASTESSDLFLGDNVEVMRDRLDSESVDLSLFSPPFLDLYTYTPTERDLGNSGSEDEFFEHFGYVIEELMRVTVPGRLCCVHVSQVPATKVYDGYIGIKDFRGDVIRAFQEHGWIYHSDITIDKNPQAAATRSKAKGLLFVTLDKDSSDLRSCFADYLLVFKKPGDNPEPITPVDNGEMTREDWIEWARPIWTGIRETETLNTSEAKDQDDEKHIVPLQLETIRRAMTLYSNPGETVLDPFMGIGSVGYVAAQKSRRFIGIDLKESYYQAARKNIRAAEEKQRQLSLVDQLHQVNGQS